MKLITKNKWRAILITVGKSAFKNLGLWNLFWGTDIFINKIPCLKALVLINFIVWLIGWFNL